MPPFADRPAPMLRPMRPEDLEAVHGLTVALKWPHRLEDWRMMLALGAGLVALDDDGTSVIGSILWWAYGGRAATLGMVIVSDAHQGRGLGRALMDAAMRALDGCTIILNATTAGLPLYGKLGFVATGSVEQHQGVAGPVPMAALEAGTRLRPTGRSDVADFVACDRAATGMDRSALLEALRSAETIVLDRDGEMAGYAVCRRFGRGFVVGPVVAPNAAGAMALIAHWIGLKAGQFLRVDIPVESGLSGWLDGIGLKCVDRVTSMVAGPGLPPLGADGPRRFALCSQALG